MGVTGAPASQGVPRRRGFPRILTSFIGRADEVQAVRTLLARHHLVTIVGPGGIGKTRLAAEVGTLMFDQFDGRAWLVELASTDDAGLVASVVADTVGIRQAADRSAAQSVAELLSAGPSLLVLDNCEHIVPAVSAFCAELLSLVDEVRILATSREPLMLPGEARMRLKPLDAHASARIGHPAPGVELFLDRVRLVDPDIELTEQTYALAAQIVRKVDGLPLAIELAAARGESLGLAQLSAMLEESLDVLADEAATAQERHRSLRATVGWSYRLLDGRQQRAFRLLAIFPAGFTLEAAAAVVGSTTIATVLHLVDCSLLTPPSVGSDGTTRYRMVESVRAFALERLERSGGREGAASRMAEYALAAAARFAEAMQTPGGELRAALWFDNDEAMVRHSLHWALDHEPTWAVRLALALSAWWQLRGRAPTGYPLLARAATRLGHRDPSWGAAQIWLGRLAHGTARWLPALEHFTEACGDLASPPASTQRVDALVGRSGTLRNMIRLPEATAVADQARRLAQRLHYVGGEAYALTQLSLAALYEDDTATALRWALQAEQLDTNRMPDRVARRVCLAATIAHIQAGDPEQAREACSRGLASAEAAGDVALSADFQYCATQIDLRTRNFADAGVRIVETLSLTARTGNTLRLLGCLHDCARLCADTGRLAEAVTLWAANSALSAAMGTPGLLRGELEERTGPLQEAARALGPVAFAAAERRGTTMSVRTAAEFAGMLAAAGPGAGTLSADAAMLTPRERELLTLVAQGRTDTQIAEELFISIRTVRSHLDRIRDKTGCRRRAELTRFALNARLL